jgi:hypothetical protein
LSIESEGSLVFNPASFESFIEQKTIGIGNAFSQRLNFFARKE